MTTIRLSTTTARVWDRSGGADPAPGVPIALAESWRRSREAGVSAERHGDPGSIAVGPGPGERRRRPTTAQIIAETEALLVAGTSEFDGDARLAVVEPDGMIVATFGGGDFGRRADVVGFRPGRRWAESDRGTNGIGTCLAIGESVLVRSAAHVERQLHQLASGGVPILGPGGELAGALGILLPRDLVGQHPIRPLRIAARSIERLLSRRSGASESSPLPETIERLIARTDAQALLFEAPGAVRAASPTGHAFLEQLRRRAGTGDVPAHLSVEALLGMGWAALAEVAAEAGAEPIPLTIGSGADERFEMHLEMLACEDGRATAVLGLLAPVRPRRTAGSLREVSVRTIVGSDAAFVDAKRTAEQFARTDLPILLVAETGAGKEVLARAIHDSSPRASGPFVAINCGSLSPQLLESELFGYGPGAFTGARPEGHDGKIKAAEQGTLFLDEVAEMPPALQSSLLRVLEDGSYYRVGETILRRADIRIICATWRDLPLMIREDRFRQDLYYRIKGACISIPPLRRRSDVADIANFLLDKLCFEMKLPQARLTKDAMALVKAFPWPGNIRELRSAVHHALVLGEGRHMLHPAHLPAEVRDYTAPDAAPPPLPAAAPPPPPAPAPAPAAAPTRPRGFDILPLDRIVNVGMPAGSSIRPTPWRPLARPAGDEPEPAPLAAADPSPADCDRLEDLQAQTLQRVLSETRGNLSETARRLGVARSTLYRLLERHGLREERP
jgi:transcriptional regulator of acetoin/glycerol metabolism